MNTATPTTNAPGATQPEIPNGLRKIGAFLFPDYSSGDVDWQPVIRYRALHTKVLVVARTRYEGAWKAYCAPVAGMSHDREAVSEEPGSPLANGADVGEKVARVLFPEFDGIPYAR